MPYIPQDTRKLFADFASLTGVNPGELNYLFTELICRYVLLHGLKYQTINDVIGALEGAKLEFYRRIAVPYEDKKIQENGDVYD